MGIYLGIIFQHLIVTSGAFDQVIVNEIHISSLTPPTPTRGTLPRRTGTRRREEGSRGRPSFYLLHLAGNMEADPRIGGKTNRHYPYMIPRPHNTDMTVR